MKKNPTSVPTADSTTPPPTEATLRRAASAARVIHSWISVALTESSSRASRATGPITGYCSSCSNSEPSRCRLRSCR